MCEKGEGFCDVRSLECGKDVRVLRLVHKLIKRRVTVKPQSGLEIVLRLQ